MRELINIVTEAGLSVGELSPEKHNGAYLKKLIQLATVGPVEASPDKKSQFPNGITLSNATILALQQTAEKNIPLPSKPVFVLGDGREVIGSWSAIHKSREYTGLEGKKTYNAGHLAELFMGLSVSAKFFNLGKPITVQNVIDMFGYVKISTHVNPKTSKATTNIRFDLSNTIEYTGKNGKADKLTFVGVIPGGSAQSFIDQVRSRNFPNDITAVLSSAVLYVNESASVAASVKQVASDPASNQIQVVSDGTSDAKMTKADIVLSIDGKKINLFSLKTYASKTMGQIADLPEWFEHSFGFNLKGYEKYLDMSLPLETRVKNTVYMYDEVIWPKIVKELSNHKPSHETAIIKRLAKAANYHARGAGMEEVEVVKLDDSITSGSYKILKFSDNLHEAMSKLTLFPRRVAEGTQGRTIQILVKPESELKHGRYEANMLCQFRSQKMGQTLRNYFEIGDIMIALTELKQTTKESIEPLRQRRLPLPESIRQRR